MLDSYDAFFQQLGQSITELLESDPAETGSFGRATDTRHVEDASPFASRACSSRSQGRCVPSSGSYGTPIASSRAADDDEDQDEVVQETEQEVEETEVEMMEETEQEVEETEVEVAMMEETEQDEVEETPQEAPPEHADGATAAASAGSPADRLSPQQLGPQFRDLSASLAAPGPAGYLLQGVQPPEPSGSSGSLTTGAARREHEAPPEGSEAPLCSPRDAEEAPAAKAAALMGNGDFSAAPKEDTDVEEVSERLPGAPIAPPEAPAATLCAGLRPPVATAFPCSAAAAAALTEAPGLVPESPREHAQGAVGATGTSDGNPRPLPRPPSAVREGFGGFSTAGGKELRLSEEALRRGRALVAEEGGHTNAEGAPEPPSAAAPLPTSTGVLGGFSTAGGKELRLSEEALRRGRSLVEEDEGRNRTEETPVPSLVADALSSEGFGGFSTAGGKQVKLSEEALRRGRNLMMEEDVNNSAERTPEPSSVADAPSSEAFGGFLTAGGKQVKLSQEALERGQALLEEGGSNNKDERTPEPSTADSLSPIKSFGCFMTARGKQVKLSEEALKRGRSLMEETNEGNDSTKRNPESLTAASLPFGDFCGFLTGRGKQVKLSEEALERGRSLMEADSSAEKTPEPAAEAFPPSFGGFSTGGKQVKLSEEALRRGGRLVEAEEDNNSAERTPATSAVPFPPSFGGFSTAGGKRMKLSEEALRRGRRLVEAEEDVNISAEKTPQPSSAAAFSSFGGFLTAGGKQVELSEEALRRGRSLVEEEEDVNTSAERDSRNFSSSFCTIFRRLLDSRREAGGAV